MVRALSENTAFSSNTVVVLEVSRKSLLFLQEAIAPKAAIAIMNCFFICRELSVGLKSYR